MWRKYGSRASKAMLILALAGLAIAFYDSHALYNNQPLWCPPPIDGCNEVANSSYARILAIPIGYFGVVYYAYMLGLAGLLGFDQDSHALRWSALGYSAIGLGFSIYFMYLQVNFIRAFCIYCGMSGVVTLLLFSAAVVEFNKEADGASYFRFWAARHDNPKAL